jgi:hypothetical protein
MKSRNLYNFIVISTIFASRKFELLEII